MSALGTYLIVLGASFFVSGLLFLLPVPQRSKQR